MSAKSRRRPASRTGCLLSPNRSTIAGNNAPKCSFRCSPATAAAEANACRAPWHTLKLLSFNKDMEASTRLAVSLDDKDFRHCSSRVCSLSTPAILSFVSLDCNCAKASSIVVKIIMMLMLTYQSLIIIECQGITKQVFNAASRREGTSILPRHCQISLPYCRPSSSWPHHSHSHHRTMLPLQERRASSSTAHHGPCLEDDHHFTTNTFPAPQSRPIYPLARISNPRFTQFHLLSLAKFSTLSSADENENSSSTRQVTLTCSHQIHTTLTHHHCSQSIPQCKLPQ